MFNSATAETKLFPLRINKGEKGEDKRKNEETLEKKVPNHSLGNL